MKDMNQHTGYAAVEFDEASQKHVMDWSMQLKSSDLVTANINGKIKGGNVTEKLHLTIFYGFDEDNLDQSNLVALITKLDIPTVNIVGIGMFPAKEFDCNVLYFSVSDESGKLQSAFERLKGFPHFANHQNINFKPHITIAYVTKDFNPNLLSNEYPRQLKVKQIVHHSCR